MLTEKDLIQIKDHGISVDQAVSQLEMFMRGIPCTQVVTAASIGNGIEVISQENQEALTAIYDARKEPLDIVKFVPASGAATRMFKFLHNFLEFYDPEKQKFTDFLKQGNHQDVARFFGSFKEFAFISKLRKKIRKKYPNYKQCNKGQRYMICVKSMLDKDGLNFGNLPKGLIPFHKYTKYAVTAFEEQLYEAAFYAVAKEDVYLHFTFSEKHVDLFKSEFERVKNRVSKKTKKNFHISYSFQKKETDTIAVTPTNQPFRDENENIVFRPSGHGALIENLNEVDADVIFIKNIDNVVSENYVEEIAHYKKVLAGKLLWLQGKMFGYLEALEKGDVSLEVRKEITSFIWNQLHLKGIPEGIAELTYILNKPLRVCGVVKNTGAPGGGPFWVVNETGLNSLQIVETAQIDMTNPHQKAIVQEATHFNPVDLVCGVRDYKGNKFDLTKFVDPNSGFISNKSQNGKDLKALELPGLWNGAMAKWNTAFVEVPLITFNPVKTVNDLLQKEHRPLMR